jgi:CBS domain containing-hemolysin-like protein
MIELLLVLISLGLVAACGAFVAAEFAFVTVDRPTVERAAADGDRKARGTLAALRSLSTQLSAAQVGITVTNLVIGFMAEPAIADLIDAPLEALGVPGGAVRGVSVALALSIATSMTMIFGELVPKNLAIARPLQTARAVQGFQRGFTRTFAPLVRFSNGTANRVLRRLGIEPQEELASARSPQELVSLVERSAEQGTLELETATLLQRSLAFGDRRAHDVLTPRVRMHDLDADEPVRKVLTEARATGHSRFPVVDGEADDVVGIVHVKDAMGVPHERRGEVRVRDVMVDPLLVPSTIELDDLLDLLRAGGLQMAIVVDEFGGVDGIVTLEDLIEEIVGEVRDEHDTRDERAWRQVDGSWSLSGLLRPDEAGRIVGLVLPEGEDYETLGGLIGLELGRMPEEGDRIELTVEDYDRRKHHATLTVNRIDGRRVDRVSLRSEPIHHDEEEEDG